MAEKKTKRLGFNFLRSYFDVFNQLNNYEDKLSFVTAIINKQFLNEDPEKKNFIVNLCYQSQKHAIEKSVKGWISANKTDLQGNPLAPLGGDPIAPLGQVQGEVQGKGKEQYNKSDFLNDWNKCRTHYLKTPSNLNRLYKNELDLFNATEFKAEEIKIALHGLFKQQNITIDVMTFRPKHFLDNIEKYYDAENEKMYTLYGADKKEIQY